MMRSIINPTTLAGGGAVILFGVALNEYSKYYTGKTGFHAKDPDPKLRIAEKDVMIPKVMRERSRLVMCKPEVQAFTDCCKQYPSWRQLTTFYTCKTEKKVMMSCMNKHFVDFDFYLECKEIYLQDKHMYRETSVSKKTRAQIKELIVKGDPPPEDMTTSIENYYEKTKAMYSQTKNIDKFDETVLAQWKR